jgi:hypothetical protein
MSSQVFIDVAPGAAAHVEDARPTRGRPYLAREPCKVHLSVANGARRRLRVEIVVPAHEARICGAPAGVDSIDDLEVPGIAVGLEKAEALHGFARQRRAEHPSYDLSEAHVVKPRERRGQARVLTRRGPARRHERAKKIEPLACQGASRSPRRQPPWLHPRL